VVGDALVKKTEADGNKDLLPTDISLAECWVLLEERVNDSKRAVVVVEEVWGIRVLQTIDGMKFVYARGQTISIKAP